MSRVDYESLLDVDTVRTRLAAKVADYLLKYEIVTAVMGALKRFDGKPITKRLETAVKAALPAYTVYYKLEYGMFKLVIWGGGKGDPIPYNDRIDLLLGYDTNPVYNHDHMIRPPAPGNERYPDGGYAGYASFYLSMKDEADKYVKVYKDNLPAKVAAFNAARKAYNDAIAAFGPATHTVFYPR